MPRKRRNASREDEGIAEQLQILFNHMEEEADLTGLLAEDAKPTTAEDAKPSSFDTPVDERGAKPSAAVDTTNKSNSCAGDQDIH